MGRGGRHASGRCDAGDAGDVSTNTPSSAETGQAGSGGAAEMATSKGQQFETDAAMAARLQQEEMRGGNAYPGYQLGGAAVGGPAYAPQGAPGGVPAGAPPQQQQYYQQSAPYGGPPAQMALPQTVVVMPSPLEAEYLAVRSYARTFMVLCVLEFVFGIFWLATPYFYRGIISIIGASIGMAGARKLHKKMMLVFVFFLFVEVIIQIVFAALDISDVWLVVLVIVLQLWIISYLLKFISVLPDDGIEHYRSVEPQMRSAGLWIE